MSSLAHPDHWPDPVVDTYDSVLAESPELAGAAFSTLVEACELLAPAYALDKVAAAANYISTGSTGQTTAHPCLVEARLARTEASASWAVSSSPRTEVRPSPVLATAA